jgi:hypothetical protein
VACAGHIPIADVDPEPKDDLAELVDALASLYADLWCEGHASESVDTGPDTATEEP